MVVIAADEPTVLNAIEVYNSQVTIAAINGPNNIVISGDTETVQKVAANFEAKGIKVTQLKVSHAFHSHLLEPVLTGFNKVFEEINFAQAKMSLISNLTGKEVVAGQITEMDVRTFANHFNELPKPVLMFCRTGNRSNNLYQLAKQMDLLDD